MRRDQLEHAIRTACQIVGASEVIVVGSQAILGSYGEEDLPPAATMSLEIDILPIADDNEETVRLGDLIEGAAGELSPFESAHGFSIDGVDLETSALPEGWRDRLVKVQNANTAAPRASPSSSGGVSKSTISASPSSARFARRTATSSRPSWTLGWSTPTSSPSACRSCPAEFSEAGDRASAWLADPSWSSS